MEKILLDTDIGSDIDDSVALAYLLNHPDCDLLGITTVTGEPVERAKIASVLCWAAGRKDIPIYPGAAEPLIIPQKQKSPHQAVKLPNWPHQTEFPQNEAVNFMRRTIRENPGEVTLLGIGPMTNIALLFSLDPEIPTLLKQLVIMCGVFTYGMEAYTCLSEWNSRCDPHASAIIYRAPVKKIVSAGLDVTTQVIQNKEEILKAYTGKLLKTVLDFSGIYEGTRQSITYHDPLAAALIFEPSLCTYGVGHVEVELQSTKLEGLTELQKDPEGNNYVALDVDRGRFFRHFLEIANR